MRYFDNTMSTFFGKPKVNRKAILFGGTTEGRILYGVLHKKGYATNTYVATQYGASLINEDDQSIHVGRLNEEEMSRLFSEEKPDFIIDATHPFADVVTKNISDAAVANGITYYRVEREANDTSFQNIIVVNSFEEAAIEVSNIDGNVLLTTGSLHLREFSSVHDFQQRFYVRALPSEDSLERCRLAGISNDHLILMQGPFSVALNEVLMKDLDIKCLVTKNSGEVGGTPAKVEAADKTGVPVVMIGRPEEYLPDTAITLELSKCVKMIMNGQI